MPRFAVIDCEDAPKWTGHERLWIDGLRRPEDAEWRVFRAFAAELPDEPLDGVVVTGSHYSAIDDSLPWLAGLLDYVARATDDGVRVVGACFGCQVLARALGGAVARNPQGRFDIGAYEIVLDPALPRQRWAAPLDPTRSRLRLLESHEDSVVEVPPNTTLLGRTEDNPYELFLVGSRALAIQAHPELTPGLVEEKILPSLLEKRRITEEELPEIRAGMTRPLDSEPVMHALRCFLAPPAH